MEKKLTREELEKMIEEVLFKQEPESKITLYTGIGGVIDYVKSWLKQCGHDNPSDERIRAEIKSQIAAGWITPCSDGLFKLS